MDLQFIDNSTGISRNARKLIRSHASKGHRVTKRTSHLSQLCNNKRVPIVIKAKLADDDDDGAAAAAAAAAASHERGGIKATAVVESLDDFNVPSIRPPVGDFITFPVLCQITHSIITNDLGGRIDTRLPISSMWIQNTFTNEAYFHSHVAISIAVFEPETARQGSDPELLRHLSRSLQLINQKLSGESAADNATLVAIIGLSQYERVQGRYEEALVHVKGLHRLALLRGGVPGLRDYPALAQKLFRADIEIALYFGAATMFRAEDLPGQNTATWLRDLYKKDNRKSYERSIKLTLDLEPGLQASFIDLMSLSSFAGGLTTCPTRLGSYVFHDIVLFFSYRLIQIRPLHQPGVTNGFEALLHLGLVAFLTTFLGLLSGKQPYYKSVTDALRWAIQATHDERDDFQKLLLWALLLGGRVVFTEEDEYWLLPRLAEVSCALKLEEWKDVEDIVMEFPWIRSTHNKAASYSWMKSREKYKEFIRSKAGQKDGENASRLQSGVQ